MTAVRLAKAAAFAFLSAALLLSDHVGMHCERAVLEVTGLAHFKIGIGSCSLSPMPWHVSLGCS